MTDETQSANKEKDWDAVRAWANLFVAGATLIVAIVSIWLTTQISGLEDYLRSEIALRNSELDTATTQAKALEIRIRKSTATLEDLRANSDKLIASSSIAQTRLAEAQLQSLALLTDRNRTLASLAQSKEQLSVIAEETEAQREILEQFRESSVLATVSGMLFRIRYTDLFADDGSGTRNFNGPSALKEISSVGLEITDPATAHYYEKIRETAPLICRRLENFSLEFPEPLPLPELEGLKGKPTGDGRIRTTNNEIEAYNQRREDWGDEIGRVYSFNDAIREARMASSEYIGDALAHCACAALRGASSCEPMPRRPEIPAMIGQK